MVTGDVMKLGGMKLQITRQFNAQSRRRRWKKRIHTTMDTLTHPGLSQTSGLSSSRTIATEQGHQEGVAELLAPLAQPHHGCAGPRPRWRRSRAVDPPHLPIRLALSGRRCREKRNGPS